MTASIDPVADIPEGYLECRDYLHSWAPFHVEVSGRGRHRTYRRTLRCTRCQTKRTQVLDADGAILRRGVSGVGYDYSDADGYVIHGHGRMTQRDRAAIRLRSLEANYDLEA